MKKTGQQIITDVIALLRESVLVTDANGVNGEIYRPGTRPRNSVSEDIVVIFTIRGVVSSIKSNIDEG
jgi:hypothetical protein